MRQVPRVSPPARLVSGAPSAIPVVVEDQPNTHPRRLRLDVPAALRLGLRQHPRIAPVTMVRAPRRSGRLASNSCRADSLTFGAAPDGVPPVPGALTATAYAFGSASNHRSTSTRRQPTARDPRPPSLTGAGKSPARTRRHNEVRDRLINARTAGVLKIAGKGSRAAVDGSPVRKLLGHRERPLVSTEWRLLHIPQTLGYMT